MKVNARKRSIAGGIVFMLLLLVLDQHTKYLADRYLAGSAGISLISDVFELYYLENRGAAFGMLSNQQFFFVAIALLIIALAVFVYVRLPLDQFYHPLRFVCMMITAGAAGNMIDRITRGYVIDFLYFSLIDFPVFNIADCYVCVGAGLTLILLFTKYRTEEFSFLKLRK